MPAWLLPLAISVGSKLASKALSGGDEQAQQPPQMSGMPPYGGPNIGDLAQAPNQFPTVDMMAMKKRQKGVMGMLGGMDPNAWQMAGDQVANGQWGAGIGGILGRLGQPPRDPLSVVREGEAAQAAYRPVDDPSSAVRAGESGHMRYDTPIPQQIGGLLGDYLRRRRMNGGVAREGEMR